MAKTNKNEYVSLVDAAIAQLMFGKLMTEDLTRDSLQTIEEVMKDGEGTEE